MTFEGKKAAVFYSSGCLLLLMILSIMAFYTGGHPENGPVICLFKRMTGIPCPTCGVIRSTAAILHGDFMRGVYLNPLGAILLFSLIIIPVWATLDIFRGRQSLIRFFRKTEGFLLKWYVLLPLILLAVSNWFWNIAKGL